MEAYVGISSILHTAQTIDSNSLQLQKPIGSTIIPVLGSSDQTHLTNYSGCHSLSLDDDKAPAIGYGSSLDDKAPVTTSAATSAATPAATPAATSIAKLPTVAIGKHDLSFELHSIQDRWSATSYSEDPPHLHKQSSCTSRLAGDSDRAPPQSLHTYRHPTPLDRPEGTALTLPGASTIEPLYLPASCTIEWTATHRSTHHLPMPSITITPSHR